jgi:alpha-1,3-rhamnosyl/mannosyltransferase
MRVTIDARSTLLASAGIKTYTYHWVRHLQRLAPGEILAFPYLGEFGSLNHQASIFSAWTTLPRIALHHFANIPGNPAMDWMLADSDIFHASNLLQRFPRHVRVTATLHDVTCRLMPQFHTEENVQADRIFADRILRRADGLIAVSENTRQDAIQVLNLPPEKIQTIYSGVADEYFAAQPARRHRPYVLFAATIEPRKNLDALLDAWQNLKPALREEFELLVAGVAGWKSDATVKRVSSQATYLGYVPEANLPGLVAGAAVFVYPSLYEGFGFPVAQAMAAGVAVLTSNNSALPEITGDGALLVDPHSVNEIAAGLTCLLESESRRAQLASRGRQLAERFRWQTCAAQSIEFFRRVAGC